ncbi:MAG: tetratricopeptide repeat protein [Acidobacteriota bacterium]|nr:MAG: tetratricopeptide repeat protein [Acidobacteriota bacterium]
MNKENLMYGVIGLLVGSIIGFTFANNVNRSYVGQVPAAANTAAPGSDPTLPPGHPPLAPGGNSDTAMPQIAESIDKARNEPQNYEAQMTAADLYYQIQRFDDAAKFYEQAVKLRPKDAEPLIKLGNARFDGEQFAEAEKWYVKALEIDPKNLNVRTDLGLTFFLREPRDLDRAIKEFKAALAQKPDLEIALQNLMLAYKEAGDEANRKATEDKLRAINPSNPALGPRPQ